MPEYTFSTLNDSELENLSRDLLQSAFGLTLQSFKKGRDKGIDLRYATFENENTIVKHSAKHKPKFKVGDRVRIFKWKNRFEKGFKGYWTSEIFEIDEILNTSPITYKIKDLDDEEIKGRFYTNELQKTLI